MGPGGRREWCSGSEEWVEGSSGGVWGVQFAPLDLAAVSLRLTVRLGGRRLNQGNGSGEGCEASQLGCNDDGESVGNPTCECDIGMFESTSSSGKFIISG